MLSELANDFVEDKHRGKALTFLLALVQLFISGATTLNFSLFTSYLKSQGVSNAAIINVGAGNRVAFGLMMLPFGVAYSHRAFSATKIREPVFMAAAVLPGVAAYLLLGLLPADAYLVYVCFFLLGTSAGWVYNMATNMVAVNYIESPKQKAVALSMLILAKALGGVCFSVFLPSLIRQIGARSTFLVQSGLIAATYPLVFGQRSFGRPISTSPSAISGDDAEVILASSHRDPSRSPTATDTFCYRFGRTVRHVPSVCIIVVYFCLDGITYAYAPVIGILAQFVATEDPESLTSVANTVFLAVGVAARCMNVLTTWHPLTQRVTFVYAASLCILASLLNIFHPCATSLIIGSAIIAIQARASGGVATILVTQMFPFGASHASEGIAIVEAVGAVGAFIVGFASCFAIDEAASGPSLFYIIIISTATVACLAGCTFFWVTRQRVEPEVPQSPQKKQVDFLETPECDSASTP